MNKREKNKMIIDLFQSINTVAVIPSKVGGTDTYCAAVGLFHLLEKNNKKVQFIYSGRVPEGCEDLMATEHIVTDVKRKDLVVAVDYAQTEIENVQYSTQDGVFYMRLGPVHKDFDVANVRAEVIGHRNDLYIIIGAQMPHDLGQVFYDLEKDMLTGKIINLDITDRNSRFGHYNIVDPLKDSLSLLTLHSALEWDFIINPEAAKAFLTGISSRKSSS